jgi:pyruvate dehydrogenase E2 component (dihydrolipoyllysine-residue acetyltransferase)
MIMPKMGDGMEEGTLLRWLKQVGEEITAGDPIAEIETDKVSLEIEATESGTFSKSLVEEGATVPIGTPIALIGEEAPGDAPAEAAAPAAAAAAAAPEPAAASANGHAPAAAPEPVPAAAAVEAAAAPQVVDRAPGERLRASPLVRRLAEEHDLDLSQIAGSGPGGRIVKDDVMPFVSGEKPAPRRDPAATVAAAPAAAPAPAQAAAPVAAPVYAAPAGRPDGEVREMSRIRKTTGKRMSEAKQVIPHFYVTVEVDMGAAVAFREQINAQIQEKEGKVSFNDFVVKAAALALREYPNLNQSLNGDTLYTHANIDVNLAVAIEGGLIAPFIADADQKSLGTIARMSKDLAGRARNGGLLPEEYQGGTFTISNLGMFDVDEFIAIINPPQAAILAVGSIREQPVVVDGELAVGHRMKLSLSADHRITDGAEVARFLGVVKKFLQNPVLLAIS